MSSFDRQITGMLHETGLTIPISIFLYLHLVNKTYKSHLTLISFLKIHYQIWIKPGRENGKYNNYIIKMVEFYIGVSFTF